MRMRWAATVAVAGASALAVAGSARSQAAAGPLQAQADAMVPNKSEWSVMAYSLDRNEVLFSINGEKPMVPASNNKVFSAIWALSTLGPDYRFPTDMLVTGPVQGGVLRGDVVIRGSGDPAFGYPEYEKDNLRALRVMAQRLKSMGVTRVEGSIVGDPYIHDRTNYGPAWPLDTGMGASRYAPTVSGLPFHRNMLWVEMNAAAPQGFILHPDVPEIPVVWRSRGGRGFAVRKPDEDTIRIRGSGGGRGTRFGVGTFEPAMLAPGALRQAMREAGIQVPGAVRVGRTPKGARLLHRHLSIPLGQMTKQLNQHSDNFFAEHFYKAAVAKTTGQGSYTRGGASSANFFHTQAGVPYGELWQADGSGLSAQNRASAHSLVMALRFADKAPYSELFHQSMAVAGDPRGTMKRMFVGTPAANNLHAKTGYIRNVRTLSGYVKTASGERVVFSLLYNGRNTSGARGVQTQLGTLLASYRR